MLGAIVVGNLGDIFGRRIMIMNGVLFFGIFTIAGAYVKNVSMLAETRFLSAVFLGGAIANAIAFIIDYSPKDGVPSGLESCMPSME
jgi:AAHS family 4-hydroxybenzoate transporter-like MFS transporter